MVGSLGYKRKTKAGENQSRLKRQTLSAAGKQGICLNERAVGVFRCEKYNLFFAFLHFIFHFAFADANVTREVCVCLYILSILLSLKCQGIFLSTGRWLSLYFCIANMYPSTFFFPGQLAVFQKNPYAQFEVSTSQGLFPIHSLRYLPPPCVCKRFNWKDVWLSQFHKVPDRYQESDLLSVSSFLRFPTSIPWKHGILPLLGNMEWRVWFSRQSELE